MADVSPSGKIRFEAHIAALVNVGLTVTIEVPSPSEDDEPGDVALDAQVVSVSSASLPAAHEVSEAVANLDPGQFDEAVTTAWHEIVGAAKSARAEA